MKYKFKRKKKRISIEWRLFLTSFSIVLVSYLLIYFFWPRKCPTSIVEKIRILRKNVTSISKLLNTSDPSISSNISLVLLHLTEAEGLYRNDKCEDAKFKLNLAIKETGMLINILRK